MQLGEEYCMGIDPGSTNAGYAFYNIHSYHCGSAMDTYTRKLHIEKFKPVFCVMEKVGAMPEDSKNAVSKFMRSVGVWEGILGVYDIPIREVPPRVWARSVGITIPACLGMKKDAKKRKQKKAKLAAARIRFPKADLSLEKHIDKAEALFMAECAHNLFFGKQL